MLAVIATPTMRAMTVARTCASSNEDGTGNSLPSAKIRNTPKESPTVNWSQRAAKHQPHDPRRAGPHSNAKSDLLRALADALRGDDELTDEGEDQRDRRDRDHDARRDAAVPVRVPQCLVERVDAIERQIGVQLPDSFTHRRRDTRGIASRHPHDQGCRFRRIGASRSYTIGSPSSDDHSRTVGTIPTMVRQRSGLVGTAFDSCRRWPTAFVPGK